MSVSVVQIVLSDKFKHNNEGLKHFIGYQEGEIVKPLCIILPQMSGYVKYFENGGKKCLFWFKMTKCGKNTNKFGMWLNSKVLSIKFFSEPVDNKTYLKLR